MNEPGQTVSVGSDAGVGLPSDAELRAILLTTDGRGKEAKAKALEILLNRRFPSGAKDMPASAYQNEGLNVGDRLPESQGNKTQSQKNHD